MNKNNELSEKLSLAGNLFTFTNNSIECTITKKIVNDIKEDFLLIEQKDTINQFSFAPKTGLIRTGNNDDSVLRSFLSFSFNDTEAIAKLINEYGFLTTLNDKKLYTVDCRKLNRVITRFKCLASLILTLKRIDEIKTIEDKKIICDQIYDFTTLLIFEDPLQMIPSDNEIDFRVVEINPLHKAIWAGFDFEKYYDNIVEKMKAQIFFGINQKKIEQKYFKKACWNQTG